MKNDFPTGKNHKIYHIYSILDDFQLFKKRLRFNDKFQTSVIAHKKNGAICITQKAPNIIREL